MEKKISNNSLMNKSDLENLSQSELINLLLNQDKMLRQLLKEKQQKPIPKPRKSVKQMVQSYEDNIIFLRRSLETIINQRQPPEN